MEITLLDLIIVGLWLSWFVLNGYVLGTLGSLKVLHRHYLKKGGQRKGFMDFMRHSHGEWGLVLLNPAEAQRNEDEKELREIVKELKKIKTV